MQTGLLTYFLCQLVVNILLNSLFVKEKLLYG